MFLEIFCFFCGLHSSSKTLFFLSVEGMNAKKKDTACFSKELVLSVVL
jgi:hypothetical protein